jgi:ubiquitin-protein ligase
MNQRRINREEERLREKYPNTQISLFTTNANTATLTVADKTFVLSADYPFRPPNVFVRGTAYEQTLSPPPTIQRMLFKTGQACPCCVTIMCRWHPSDTIQTILEEMQTFNRIKTSIRHLLSLQQVANKHHVIKIVINEISEYLK